jgi:hypothetical protein
MFRIVVHKHVVRHGKQNTVHAHARRYDHLKTTHIAWVARIFQTILVAFQKELEKKPLGK